MRPVMLMSSLLLSLLFSHPVSAYTCTTNVTTTTLSPPNLVLQRDLPVGSIIGSQISSGTVTPRTCSNSPPPSLTYQEVGINAHGTYLTTFDDRRIYRTNIAGIGYAVGAKMNNTCPGATKWVDGTDNIDGNLSNRALCAVNGLIGITPAFQAQLLFYKTAASHGYGTVTAGQFGSFILRNDKSSWHSPKSTLMFNAFTVASLACTVTNSAITINMGTVEKRHFNGVGTWPGDGNTKRFNITLNCNPGTRVNVKLDGSAQNVTQGVLNLHSGNNTATGVGIQLLYRDKPLPLKKVILAGTPSSAGTFNIPLKARYYQTSHTITTGTANSSATFTLTYQ